MRRLLSSLLALPVRVFYRRWTLGGTLPEEGPLLLVANHPNGLIDPVVAQTLTHRPLRFLAKEPLFRMPVVGRIVRAVGSLPVHRPSDGADAALNSDTFQAVFDALAAGEAVCLFPEGVSHSEPTLQRLKTGAARMALGAEAQGDFELGVRIVPVGLVYGSKQRFRSKLATWVGEPIAVDDLGELHREDERAAVAELTRRVERGLRRVTVNLDRWEELPLLEIVERIWQRKPGPPGPGQDPTPTPGAERNVRLPEARPGARVARLGALAQGVRALRERDPERLRLLERNVQAFAQLLQRLRISPDDLRIDYRGATVARFAVRHLLGLLIGLPLALLGLLAWGAPYLLVAAVVPLARPSEDVVATYKLLAALLLYPLWWAGVAVALALEHSGASAAAWAVLAPLVGRFALVAIERQFAAREDVATFLRIGSRRALKERLRARRDELATELDAVAGEMGRQRDGSPRDGSPAR